MKLIKDLAESAKPFSVRKVQSQLSNVSLKYYLPINVKWNEIFWKKSGGISCRWSGAGRVCTSITVI